MILQVTYWLFLHIKVNVYVLIDMRWCLYLKSNKNNLAWNELRRVLIRRVISNNVDLRMLSITQRPTLSQNPAVTQPLTQNPAFTQPLTQNPAFTQPPTQPQTPGATHTSLISCKDTSQPVVSTWSDSDSDFESQHVANRKRTALSCPDSAHAEHHHIKNLCLDKKEPSPTNSKQHHQKKTLVSWS